MKTKDALNWLNNLEADVRASLAFTRHLQQEDPGLLLQAPAPGRWSTIEVIEHLCSYNRYYLPAISKALATAPPEQPQFRSGWLGNYFTKLMQPDASGKTKSRMKAPRGHRPPSGLDAAPVLQEFITQQHQLLQLLEQAKSADIGTTRVPISIARWIGLKLGDTFGFLVAHQQRHFFQAQEALRHAASCSTTNSIAATV